MTATRIAEIIEQIKVLCDELISLLGDKKTVKIKGISQQTTKNNKSKSGATGGLRMLVDEGKLDTPKQRSEIIELFKQEGRHYPTATVSMGLLNLVRERVLTRIRAKNSKKWEFVKRK
jgi:hypothetical protein